MVIEKQNICDENYAAIDIGSNAVRLLIKHLDEDEPEVKFSKVLLLRVPMRLGFDVFAMGELSPKKQKNMIRLMTWLTTGPVPLRPCVMRRTVWS